MEREDVSSLAAAASRLSLPSSAGRSPRNALPDKSCVLCTRIRKPGLPRGRCPPRSARPFALRVLAPPRCARSPQKAPLEDLSVCYPRVRHVASGMCHAAALRRTNNGNCKSGRLQCEPHHQLHPTLSLGEALPTCEWATTSSAR